MTTLHQLYRYYDKDKALLYIGISVSAVARLVSHKQNAEWYSNATTMVIENHVDRKTLELAERLAIAWEKPLHNVNHNIQPVEPVVKQKRRYVLPTDGKVARYISTLTDTERQLFLKKSGLSQTSLNHIIAGRLVQSADIIIRIIDASDGVISVESLNPEIFPDADSGRRRKDMFLIALKRELQAA